MSGEAGWGGRCAPSTPELRPAVPLPRFAMEELGPFSPATPASSRGRRGRWRGALSRAVPEGARRRVIGPAMIAALALAPGLGCADTLRDSILLAYQTNPTLRAQRAELRAIDEGYVQARSGLGPQVNLTGQGGFQTARVQGMGVFGQSTDTSYQGATGSGDLSVVQPLYTAGATTAKVRGATADILAGRQALRKAEAQVIENVITAYMDVRRDREDLKVLREEIAILGKVFEETRAKGALGQLTRTDVAEAESRLLSARAQLVLVEGRLNASNAEYLAAVGQNPGELEPEPELIGMPATVDEAFDTADRNSPQIRQAMEAERSAHEKVNQAKSAFGPTLALRADAAVAPNLPYIQDQYYRSVTVAASITQPLFTSGLNSSRVREAAARDSEALLQIEAARRGVTQAVAQAWSNLAAAREAADIQARQVAAERIAFEGNRIEERVGLRSTIDLLNAEQELASGRLTLVQTRHDDYLARAALLSAMGLLESRFLAPGAETYDPQANFNRVRKIGAAPWEGAVEAIDQLAAPRTQSPANLAPGTGGQRPRDLPPLPGPAIADGKEPPP